ncbi:MAG: SDR family NAD(P)-dependent oxidoreductase [Azospirillaceae bacterium]|nr:SDR family NAD(P)-dependent oxidoreductase [Azospirillaceae bacterium]
MTTEKKTALVTGANKGIGYEVARRLAEQGHAVWLGCRDTGRGEAAAGALRGAGLDVRFIALDVADGASVAQAAAALAQEMSHLDILVNNTGILAEARTRPSDASIDAMKAVYEVNVFGPARVTQAFLPLLRAATAARVVMVSSGLGSLTGQSDPNGPYYAVNSLAYCTSKTALNAVTLAFAKDLADTGIKVNAACPGHTATDLNGHSGPRTVQQAATVIIDLATLPAIGPTGGFFNEDGPLPW